MSDPTEAEVEESKIRLKRDGHLVQVIEGTEVPVAFYDKKTGYLEYESQKIAMDKDLPRKITARITMTKGEGTAVHPSENVIRNVGVKGQARPDPKKLPPKPKKGPLGDAAYDIAKWYFDNDPTQAKILYKCVLDANGDFVRKHAKRVVVTMIDERDQDGASLGRTQEGKASFTTGPVSRVGDIYENQHAIIAYRETHPGPDGEPPMTFTPQEVVGGFQPDDEFEQPVQPQAED